MYTEPEIVPVTEDNPMYALGFQWEAHYPDGSRGHAHSRDEAGKLIKQWLFKHAGETK